MPTVKRLLIWFIETCSEVLLLGLAVLGMVGYEKGAFAKDLAGSMSVFVLLSFTTGYLFTTVTARVAWRSRKLWSYSVIAIMLFLLHSELFFLVSGADRHDLKNLSCC